MNEKACLALYGFCGERTSFLMRDAVIALLPAVGGAIVFQGWDAVRVLLSAVAACFLSDWGFVRLRGAAWDGSALVTGLLLGLLLPADCPWWAAALGGLAAMGCKTLSGGLGRNIWNPAALGRALLMGFPSLRPAPLRAAAGRFLMGYTGGSLGEISSLLLVAGAAYLLVRHLLPLSITGPAFAAAFLTGTMIPNCDALAVLAWGGTAMTACFLAVDPVSSPMGLGLQGLYGAACGACCTLAAYYFGGVAGACAALLGLNLAFRCLERMFR